MSKHRQPTSATESITPAIATDILNRNKNNRPLNERMVLRYAVEMTQGRWMNNGESIIIDWNDNLLNGQHRLYAIVESGKTIESVVVRNVDPASFVTMDTGKKRNAADCLSISGISSGINTQVAAAANICLQYLHSGTLSKKLFSHAEIIEFVKANPIIVDYVKGAVSGKNWTRSYGTMLASIRWISSGKYSGRAKEFYDRFLSGEGLDSGSPILALRNRFSSTTEFTRLEKLAMLVVAWNAFVDGRPVFKLQVPSMQFFPRIEGGTIMNDIVKQKRSPKSA
jgi:hypothetical protein